MGLMRKEEDSVFVSPYTGMNPKMTPMMIPMTPRSPKISDVDAGSERSNSESPQSQSSPNMVGLLTLPTVLQEDGYDRSMGSAISGLCCSEQHQQEHRSMNHLNVNLLDPELHKLFLPGAAVFPKPPNPFFSLGMNHGLRWLSENPLRQRGLRFRPEEDPGSFVTCQLCGNSILGNREINLQNHARRHSTLKQFQCCYCHYVHSEITKVRLHMSHNHNDNCSRPINNVNGEMRESWRALMGDCFPGHPFVNDQLQRRYTQQATQVAIQFQRAQLRYCPF